jgi:hypothetical protein
MGILAMVYDPKSTIQMFIYVSCMSQILKDYIWIQLRFKDIMNLWPTQGNLVGRSQCEGMHD